MFSPKLLNSCSKFSNCESLAFTKPIVEEISIQLNLSSNEKTIILNEVEQTESDFTKSVSDGNAE